MGNKILIRDVGMYQFKKGKRRYRGYEVECPICGKRRVIGKSNFYKCKTTECNICKNIKHGGCYTPLYKVWKSMKQRCYNKNDRAFMYYGGRGISICNTWITSFTEFKNWATNNGYKKGLTIDRVNNNGNYEPENCRWVDMVVQRNNTRLREIEKTSKYRGVFLSKGRYWVCCFVYNKKYYYVGSFKTETEAATAYNNYVKNNNFKKQLNIL